MLKLGDQNECENAYRSSPWFLEVCLPLMKAEPHGELRTGLESYNPRPEGEGGGLRLYFGGSQ